MTAIAVGTAPTLSLTAAEVIDRLAATPRRFTPIDDRLVLRPRDEGEQMHGSILIPEVAREKPQEATVVAAGPTTKAAKVGDVVLYGKYSGTEVTIDDVDYLIMREADLLLVFG